MGVNIIKSHKNENIFEKGLYMACIIMIVCYKYLKLGFRPLQELHPLHSVSPPLFAVSAGLFNHINRIFSQTGDMRSDVPALLRYRAFETTQRSAQCSQPAWPLAVDRRAILVIRQSNCLACPKLTGDSRSARGFIKGAAGYFRF